MLDGKNNDLSLRWELNFIIMQILRKEIVLYCQPTWPPCQVGANQEYCERYRLYILCRDILECDIRTAMFSTIDKSGLSK